MHCHYRLDLIGFICFGLYSSLVCFGSSSMLGAAEQALLGSVTRSRPRHAPPFRASSDCLCSHVGI